MPKCVLGEGRGSGGGGIIWLKYIEGSDPNICVCKIMKRGPRIVISMWEQ